MEEAKKFVDETDYKGLWKYSYDKCEHLTEENSDLLDKIEDMEREFAEMRRELQDRDDEIRRLEERVVNLLGQVDAHKYAIRYCMVGDAQ